MKSILIKILLALVFLGLGLGGGVGYGRYQLTLAEKAHSLEADKLNRKLQQWEKKYNERNARIEIGRRTVQRLQQEIGGLKDEVANLQLSEAAAVKKQKAHITVVEQALVDMEYQRLKLQAREEHLADKLTGSKARVAELEKLSTEWQGKAIALDQGLRKMTRDHDRCFKHNQEMAVAAGELLERYQNKKFWNALGEKEPVTGIGQVELEHIVQEYGFKIEDHRLEK